MENAKWAVVVPMSVAVSFKGTHEEAQKHRDLLVETIKSTLASKGITIKLESPRILQMPQSVPTLDTTNL